MVNNDKEPEENVPLPTWGAHAGVILRLATLADNHLLIAQYIITVVSGCKSTRTVTQV
jgi:hypothetical protein